MKSPNVVLIITDQQRYDTIRAAGQENIRTPNLDRLAAEGMLFSHAYCTCPMCSPARASLLSGLFPHAHRLVSNHQGRPGCNRIHLPEDVKLLADYMQPAGYRTAYVGKWHLGTGSDRRGFRDFVVRFGDGEGDTSRPEDNDYFRYTQKIGLKIGGKRLGKDPAPHLYDRRVMCGPSLAQMADHASMFTCNKAEEFIRDSAGKNNPFLLVYSCIEPHPPFVCPEPFYSMYEPNQIVLPQNWQDESGQKFLQRADWQLRSALDFSDAGLKRMWAAYLGAVSYIDYLVGRMLSALSDTDQLEDTLFIFTSDHGEMLGSHSLLLKGASFYEELMRIPLIIRPPGGAAGSHQCDSLISQVDLVPTILKSCGLDVPENLEGVDFSRLLHGEQGEVREAVPGEFHSSNWTDPMSPLRMWRTSEWKYVESKEGDDELYHLAEDPDELHNLSGEREYASVQKKLAGELHEWCRQTGDAWPEVPIPTPEYMEEAKKQKIQRASRH